MPSLNTQIKFSVDFSKRELANVLCGKGGEMRKWMRILAVILIFSLPIWVDEICKFHPESYYCQAVKPYVHDPELISTRGDDVILFSGVVQASGVTTTVLPSGTISESTTTTT